MGSWRTAGAAAGVLTALCGSAVAAQSACPFDAETLSFAGSAEEQARCLLRPVRRFAHLGEVLERLPEGLAGLPGSPVVVTKEALRGHLLRAGIAEAAIGGSLDEPLSRSHTNDPAGLPAIYLVIHDTSTPNLLEEEFPAGIDLAEWPHNALARWDQGSSSKAHVFINRVGESVAAIGFGMPWRATRLEIRLVGTASRGRFLHVELVQPRRSAPEGPSGNDAEAPEPGFSDAQLERLALVYLAASVRAGTWLVPAYHAVVDSGIPGAHDDPQGFDLERWSSLLGGLIRRLSPAEPIAPDAALEPR